MKCIPSTSTCKQEGFDYVFGKECRKNCDNYYKLMDENGKDTIRCFETLDKALDYDFDNNNNKDIKFYNIELKQCWFKYHDNFYIKYEKNGIYEVVESCDDYYYNKITNGVNSYYCIDNCQKVNLYFESGNKQCIPCTKYYDPTNNECLETCTNRINLEYAYPTDNTTPQKCLNKCPYYFETKTNSIDSCSNPKFINAKTKECLDNCDTSTQYEFDNFCYPKCTDPNRNYINSDTNECVLSCPSNLKNIIKIATDGQREIFLCKTSCEDNQFRLEDKCLDKCPPTHNYIGNNKICRRKEDKCNGDPNGEKYFPINEDQVANENDILYNCTDSCNKAIVTENSNTKNYFYYTSNEPNECLEQCKQTYSYYLQDEYECKNECPEDFPFYNKNTLPSNHWKCENTNPCTDPDPYYLNGECLSACQSPNNYIDSDKKCLSECKNGEIKMKNLDTYKCLVNCFPDFEDIDESVRQNPECVLKCPKERNFIGKNNKCKRACDEEDGIYYYEYDEIQIDSTNSYIIFKCSDKCEVPHSFRQINNGKQCYENCEQTTNYPYKSKNENLCYDDCLKSKNNPFTTKDPNNSNENICSDKCEGTDLYYGEDKICRPDCDAFGETNIKGPDYKCVANCLGYSSNKYQLRGKCETSCDAPDANEDPSLIRYSPSDYICKEKCGRDENIVKDGKECTNICNYFKNPLYSKSDPNDYVEYECIESCINNNIDPNNKFYYENEKICIDSCKPGDKAIETSNRCIDDCNKLTDTNNKIKYYLVQKISNDPDIPYDMCVTQCPEKKPYIDIDNSECLDQCPETKRYYIKEFSHGEEDIRKKCLNDCPDDYPYYTIRNDNNIIYYECQATCQGFIVPNIDTNTKAKRCLSSCPEDVYNYKIFNEEENKKYCYKQCPDNLRYHYEFNSNAFYNDNNCFLQCPDAAPFHKNEETDCFTLSELQSGYILYNEKKWISSSDITSCPSNNKTTKIDEITNNDIYICSDTCLEEYGIYETTYGTCVKDCKTSSLAKNKNLINDEYNKKCVCEDLFYIDEISHIIKKGMQRCDSRISYTFNRYKRMSKKMYWK